ncbi:MAG: hypothetical protein J7M25_18510 [Deltaproteobacteria bacterium]|nr:hypothetical protein [Deltaproteobacteria bacterium]
MADINLTQAEADALMAMEKHRASEEHADFPMGGQSVVLPLQSADRREQFLLDLSRGRIDLIKVKMQNRGRQVFVLVRLDLGGAPHRNPDGEEIPVPHLHVYREGYGDKWAMPVPANRFHSLTDVWTTLDDFMRFCNITLPPHIERGLFT